MRRLSLKTPLAAALAAAFLLQAPSASALGLLQAYEAALQNDPTYRSAQHLQAATHENIALGRSNLLPQVSASYSKSKNRGDVTAPGFTGVPVTSPLNYSSVVSGVQLRQPIINLDGIARYRQGVAQANYGDAQYAGAQEDLILRLVGAYADAQYAEEQLALMTAQRDAYAEQMKVNNRMFEKGEGTKTDMIETQARFDLAEAQVVEAQDSLNNARKALAVIIGKDVAGLDPLSNNFQIKPMKPAAFEEWKTLAMDRNAEIVAQRHAVESAREEVNKNRAGHAPRLDFVAGVNKNSSESINTLNQDSKIRSLGIQLQIPLYSGGYVSASTTQAAENYERAKSDMDAKINQVMVDLDKQYRTALSSVAHIEALVKSVKSSSLLVEATRKSIAGGVRINLDLLNAQQQMYQAQRDLAQSRYNYILAYLRLRNAAGILTGDDVRTVAVYFAPAK